MSTALPAALPALHAGDAFVDGGTVLAGQETAAEAADFGEFVRAALPGLLRYGYALTGNPHDGADLVQSVLEKVGSRWGSVVRRTGDPLAYVRKSMANANVSRWRRSRRERLVADLPDMADVAAGSDLADRFADEPLWQALRALPPRQRAVIVLRYYDDLSEIEIADILGISRGTVKSQASKAMHSLRGHLAGEREGRVGQ
jgi:RNA polymerase sigma-70 factor (sigma-E family)